MVLARPFLKDPLAVQGKLCRRMERFIKELFVFVSDPAVPSDNNAAERSLRHLVTSRKISGGTRSGQGTDSKMTLASLFGTWRAQRSQSPPGMPPVAHFPSTLNSFKVSCSVAAAAGVDIQLTWAEFELPLLKPLALGISCW